MEERRKRRRNCRRWRIGGRGREIVGGRGQEEEEEEL